MAANDNFDSRELRPMDINHSLTLTAGALALFLYAITRLSKEMKTAFGADARRVISRYTSNLFLSILVGTLVTIALGSSSAAIIIAIIFVNAGSMSFRQAIGVVMGANIGTTFSSQLFALNLGEYAYILLIAGLILNLFAEKYPRWSLYGMILFLFGLLFFALNLIEMSLIPYKDSPALLAYMESIADNRWQGAATGGLVTLIIQSSSATVGLAIALARENILGIAAGIAVMLGAELGTCSDTLLATIKGSRQAIKTGVFHLTFNLLTIAVGLLLFTPFVELVDYLTASDRIQRHIANAHLLFNSLGVLLFIPFVPMTERLLNRLIPEKNATQAEDTPASN